MSAIENSILDGLDPVNMRPATLDIAGLHWLDALAAAIAALDPTFAAGHAQGLTAVTLNLHGSLGVAASVIGKGEGLSLNARLRKATPPFECAVRAREGLRLEAGTATTATLHAECISATAATILGAESMTASAAATGVPTAPVGSSGAFAAVAATMFAGLGARRHRYRQSGDASGKKQPGHYKSPYNLRFKRAAPQHVPPFTEPCRHSGVLA